jgi:hypothetical protein
MILLVFVCFIFETRLFFLYFCLGLILFLTYTHPYIQEKYHPIIQRILEKGRNKNFDQSANVKIKTKWEQELVNENVIGEDDDGDITLNPAKGIMRLKKLLHTTSYFFFLVEHVINMFEKVKNLLAWKNEKST